MTRPSENKLEEFCRQIDAPEKAGEFEAYMAKSALNDLVNENRNGSKHVAFNEFYLRSLEALVDYPHNPEESPVARLLLHYLSQSMALYIKLSKESDKTKDRQTNLAKAFNLSGSQGRRPLIDTDEQKIEICEAYSSALYKATNQHELEPMKDHFKIAVMAAYRAAYGVDFKEENSSTGKSRLEELNSFLEIEGYPTS